MGAPYCRRVCFKPLVPAQSNQVFSLGGMIAALLTSPLDIVKTRLQSDFYRSQRGANQTLESFSFPRSPLRHVRETFQILFSIQQVEGWRSLFRGLGPNLAGVVPVSAIKFYTYGSSKYMISHTLNSDKEAIWVHLLAAATTGIVTSTATSPIWLVKTRLQLDKALAEDSSGKTGRKYKNSVDCVRQVIREGGVRSLYRGLSASYLDITESTLHWVLYEQIKLQLSRRKERLLRDGHDMAMRDDILDWGAMAGGAGSSKLLASLITYPHEVRL
jgi:solute carrier family 25, member 33/36